MPINLRDDEAKERDLMGRFTKSAVIDDIRARATRVEEEQGFDRRTGTAQLWPPGADETTKALIDRAVAYGKWRALERVAEDIDEGQLGKPANQ